MGDISGAEILGNAFKALAAVGGRRAINEARKLYLTTRNVDCTQDEMCCDEALISLGLAGRYDTEEDGDSGVDYLEYEQVEQLLRENNDAEQVIALGALCLRFGQIHRVTLHEDGTPESDTTHTVMLGLIACAVAAKRCPELDLGLIAQYALVHDFVEAIAGDTNTLKIDAEGAKNKERREHEALVYLQSKFGKSLPWLTDTIVKYESLADSEARFVKVLDKVLPKVTHLLNGGTALRAHGITTTDQINKVNRKQLQNIAASYGQDQPEALDLYRGVHELLVEGLRKLEGEGAEQDSTHSGG